jgi:membrane protein implicated in regulation of membrane protease activity
VILERISMVSNSNFWLILTIVPLLAISILSITTQAFGADSSSQYIVRRVVIWDLFYRNMIVAFIVGAVVQGAIVYVVWRFRESNKKNFYRRPMGSEHR